MSNHSIQWDYTWTFLSWSKPWLFVQLNNNCAVRKGFFFTTWGDSCCCKNSGVGNRCQSAPAFASAEIRKLKQQGWEEPFRHPWVQRWVISAHVSWCSAAVSASNLWIRCACHFPQFKVLRMRKFNRKWRALIWSWNNGVTYKHWSRHRKLNSNIL